MDWTKINWNQSNEAIAAAIGYKPSTVMNNRYKYGPTATAKRPGDHKPFTLGTLRKMKLPGLVVTIGNERLALTRLKHAGKDTHVRVMPGDFMEAWQKKGMDILYPRPDQVEVK